MLQVKLNRATDNLEITFKYDDEYVRRMRTIPGATFDGELKAWIISSMMIEGLDREFKGELMYMTPKWEITGSPPPDYSKMYSHIPNVRVSLKAPYILYPFQQFGANYLANQCMITGFACLFDDMGTGKTIQSVAASIILGAHINLNKYVIPILVVCKSGLKYQWETDGINKFTDATSIVIDGTKTKRTKQYNEIKNNPGKYAYIIVGYETVRQDIDILSKMEIGLIIADEAHKIRNRVTKANDACSKLKAKFYFFLTGSPIGSRPDEIFGLGKVGNPKYFGTWKAYSDEFVIYKYTQFGPEIRGVKNLERLRNMIDKVSIRRTDKEVDMQMPKIIQQDILVNLTPVQKAIDIAIQEKSEKLNSMMDAVMKIQDVDKRKAEKLKLDGAIQGILALRIGCADTPELFTLSNSMAVKNTYGVMATDFKSGKLDYLMEHVQEIMDSGQKVVIFSKFETMVRILARELDKISGICTYTGKMNARQKEDSRIKFKTNSNFNIFIATNAGAEGLNLQEARYLINYDLDWDISINDQRNKRIRRLDSTFDKVFVYNYIARDSADEVVLSALKKKQDLFDYLIENNDAKSNQMKQIMTGYK